MLFKISDNLPIYKVERVVDIPSMSTYQKLGFVTKPGFFYLFTRALPPFMTLSTS